MTSRAAAGARREYLRARTRLRAPDATEPSCLNASALSVTVN